MDQKLSNQKKLDELPESSDKFWDGEVHANIVPHDWFDDHSHYFMRVTGHEAYCEGCGWGFALDGGDKIIEGHLYTREKKFVI